MQNNFTIKEATEKEREFVIAQIKNRWGLSDEDANAEFDRWLIHDLDSVCYVGMYSDKPIATGVFDTVRETDSFDIAPYNTLLWVEPEYRGHNFGKRLTKQRFDWALSKGYQVVYLDTKDAAEYHRKNGWRFVKIIMHQGEEFTIMNIVIGNKLSFVDTRNILDYSEILKPLAKDFTAIFYQTMLVWCKIIPSDNAQGDLLWQVWLIKQGTKAIGVCGLYTLNGATSTSELWLGWFGIVPELRNWGLGVISMQHLYESAKSLGCNKLYSYVDKEGGPLNFYKREGFEVIGTVGEYCQANGLPNIDGNDFECAEDFVICKQL